MYILQGGVSTKTGERTPAPNLVAHAKRVLFAGVLAASLQLARAAARHAQQQGGHQRALSLTVRAACCIVQEFATRRDMEDAIDRLDGKVRPHTYLPPLEWQMERGHRIGGGKPLPCTG